ncbi:hypothetical protein GUJ93_ZPchr0015g6949 [Zizania palustris]|uniref:Uncharacterized protein n=1 Tax=Zizania palustris TaxID=103762 RepID=A0A8J5TI33_ZIZPA|nr:hypothetical protein GUJ93_ZPchr0015g6949 [Zizania palustris]
MQEMIEIARDRREKAYVGVEGVERHPSDASQRLRRGVRRWLGLKRLGENSEKSLYALAVGRRERCGGREAGEATDHGGRREAGRWARRQTTEAGERRVVGGRARRGGVRGAEAGRWARRRIVETGERRGGRWSAGGRGWGDARRRGTE